MKLVNKTNQVKMSITLEEIIATANYCRGHETEIPEELFFRGGQFNKDTHTLFVDINTVAGMSLCLDMKEALVAHIRNVIELSEVEVIKVDIIDFETSNNLVDVSIGLYDITDIDIIASDFNNEENEAMVDSDVTFNVVCQDWLADFLYTHYNQPDDTIEECVVADEEVKEEPGNLIALDTFVEAITAIRDTMGTALINNSENIFGPGILKGYAAAESSKEMNDMLFRDLHQNALLEYIKMIDKSNSKLTTRNAIKSLLEYYFELSMKDHNLINKFYFFAQAFSDSDGLGEERMYNILDNIDEFISEDIVKTYDEDIHKNKKYIGSTLELLSRKFRKLVEERLKEYKEEVQ